MSKPLDEIDKGLILAQVASQIIGTTLFESPKQNLASLSDRLEHLSARPAEWKIALAYLSAQIWAERNNSDAAAGRDAQFALGQISAQVEWFNNKRAAR